MFPHLFGDENISFVANMFPPDLFGDENIFFLTKIYMLNVIYNKLLNQIKKTDLYSMNKIKKKKFYKKDYVKKENLLKI